MGGFDKVAISQKIDSALIEAVKSNNPVAVKKVFKSKINLNLKDPDGNTALHYAVLSSNVLITKLLLKKKANFMILNAKGKSAKQIATEKKNQNLVSLFKERIELNRKDKKSFLKVFNRITTSTTHCCQFYGQLRSNHHIKALIQKTMINGDCALDDYNPPHKNLLSGQCNLKNTYEGCRGHTQRPGSCKKECGWGPHPHCNFETTFGNDQR